MDQEQQATRRHVLGAGGALGAALLTGATAPVQAAETYPVKELADPGPLPDVWIGAAEAPVTVIEYASMTCPHCAAFHATTYPALKSKYIDTGKVRFVLREFPLDPMAAAGFMLGRCVGPDKRNAMLELLFAQQKNWAFSDKPLQGLMGLVKQTGMTQDAFEACLKDAKLYEQVNQVRDRATNMFKVDATPTFYINGQKVSGEMSPDELDKVLQPFLKS